MTNKSKSSSSSSSYTKLDPAVQAIVDDYIGRIGGLTGQDYEGYTGDRLADFTPDELQSFDIVRGLVGQTQQGIGASQNILDQVAQRGLNGFDQATLDQYMNPYLTNVMDASRDRQLSSFDIQRRNLAQQQGAIGAFGGSRSALAESSMYDNFNRQLGESEANLLYQGYNDAQNRAMQGTQMAGAAGMDLANLASMYQNAGLTDASALSAQGGQQRALNQTGLDISYQDFLTQQAYPYEQLQFGLNSIMPLAQLTGKNISNSTQKNSSGGGLGGALQTAVGLGSMAFGIPGVSSAMGSMMGGLGGMFGSMMGSPAQAYANTGFGNSAMNAFKGGMGYYGPGFNEGGAVSADADNFEHLLAAMGPERAASFMSQYAALEELGDNNISQEQLMEYIQRVNSENMGLGSTVPGFATGGSPRLGLADFTYYPLKELGANLWDITQSNYIEAEANRDRVRAQEGSALDKLKLLLGERAGNAIDEGIANRQRRAADRAVQAEALASDPGTQMMSDRERAAREMAVSQGQNPDDPMVLDNMLGRIDQGLVNDINTPNYAGGLPVDAGRNVDMTLPAVFSGLDSGSPVQQQVQAIMQAFDGAPAPTKAKEEAPAKATSTDDDNWDPSLFNFGAAVLASNGSFSQAIGEGGKAFAASKRQRKVDVIEKEAAIRKAAREARNDRIDEIRADAYVRQVAAQEAMIPYNQRRRDLEAQMTQRKLEGMDPATQKIFGQLLQANKAKFEMAAMGMGTAPSYDDLMMQAQALSGNGGLTMPSNSGTMGPATSNRPEPPAGAVRR